jgi:uncharacterized protein (TIGR03083 family)
MTPDAGLTPGRHLDATLTADQLSAALAQVSQLVSAVTDPAATAVGRWTARDAAAHIASGLELYTSFARGGSSPAATIDAITTMNDDLIATLGEATMPALGQRIRSAGRQYLAVVDMRGGDVEVPWHAGLRIPVGSLLAISLGEAVVHGHDIAHAARRPWPVPADWARTVFHGVQPVLPHYLDPGRAAGRDHAFDVRLRGRAGDRTLLSIRDGALHVGAAPAARVDCHISADPWTMVRIVYGRTGPARAAATGRVTAWGRRPWLAFVLPTLFRKP